MVHIESESRNISDLNVARTTLFWTIALTVEFRSWSRRLRLTTFTYSLTMCQGRMDMVQPGPLKRLQIFVVRKLVFLRALRWSVILLHSSPTAHHVGKVRECFALQVMIHAYSVGKLDAFIPESPKIFPGLLDPAAESKLISDWHFRRWLRAIYPANPTW